MTVKIGPYELDSIVTGDCRELAAALPDESVDLVFTDPPYHDEFVGLYGDLAAIAARVLKPGGFCFAYAGIAYLTDIFRQMGDSLDYFWTICGYQPESNQVFNAKNVGCHWRPVLLFSKGAKRAPSFFGDTWRTNREKQFHEWGQGESLPTHYIVLFTKPGAIVLDPFIGGGTTGVVCRKLGRHFIGFEMDELRANVARQRLHNTQVPLFVPEPEQAPMFAEVAA